MREPDLQEQGAFFLLEGWNAFFFSSSPHRHPNPLPPSTPSRLCSDSQGVQVVVPRDRVARHGRPNARRRNVRWLRFGAPSRPPAVLRCCPRPRGLTVPAPSLPLPRPAWLHDDARATCARGRCPRGGSQPLPNRRAVRASPRSPRRRPARLARPSPERRRRAQATTRSISRSDCSCTGWR